jgi:hypothetical protein
MKDAPQQDIPALDSRAGRREPPQCDAARRFDHAACAPYRPDD